MTQELNEKLLSEIRYGLDRATGSPHWDEIPRFPVEERVGDRVPWDSIQCRDYSVEMRCNGRSYENQKGFNQTGALLLDYYDLNDPKGALLTWLLAWCNEGSREHAFDRAEWRGGPYILKGSIENQLYRAGYGGWHSSAHSMFRRASLELTVPSNVETLAHMAFLDYLAHIGMGWTIVRWRGDDDE